MLLKGEAMNKEEIAKYQGMLEAMNSEVRRLHPLYCNCMICKGKKDE